MEKRETTGMGWFIAGLGVGSLLGVLFAPKAGREMRESLASGARDSKDFMAKQSKQAREQLNAVVDRSRDQVKDYAERGKEVADKGRERWSNIVDRVAANDTEHPFSSHAEEAPSPRGTAESNY